MRPRARLARPLRGGLDRDALAARGRARRASSWTAAPGVRVVDDPAAAEYPLPSDAVGDRRRPRRPDPRDPSRRNGLSLWIVADNLRKGAATNGVQIAELLVERDLVRVPDRAAA